MTPKKSCLRTLLFLLSGLFVIGTLAGCGDDDTISPVVVFPDANLGIAVSQALDIPVGQITVLDLQFLFSLDASGVNVANLSGLEFCTNLYELTLTGNQISDLGPLAGLQNLTWLALERNVLGNLGPLSGLVNLSYLFLSGNSISDLGPLAALTALTTLHAEDNLVADLTALSGLWRMRNLLLNGNQISDLGPLEDLTDLALLYLNENQITNVQPLAANGGLGTGDQVYLLGNALSAVSCSTYVPDLEGRGVAVASDCP